MSGTVDPSLLIPAHLHPSRVIAKGNRIRDLPRLLSTYGGRSSRWTKRSGPVFLIGNRPHELHWYHHHGIGSFEHKLVDKRIPR